jgi:hypothetical protein
MKMKDPYEILGVKRDATADEIRAAYRKLAKRHHPISIPESARRKSSSRRRMRQTICFRIRKSARASIAARSTRVGLSGLRSAPSIAISAMTRPAPSIEPRRASIPTTSTNF